ncbi:MULTISPECIES: ABC-three component system protein [unclassified Sphingomonas]|jgi:hypothetical protein|uniref:ABC-three component system protein n=1 Tax=unclassified Sphingomonas TaxID=196159 RepID=UPI0008314E38|nr:MULTISPECIES: ABC-three component system protein [unclassified Sphingomonas]
MTDRKPGTSLVPVTPKKSNPPVDERGAGSLVSRRISDLARFTEPVAGEVPGTAPSLPVTSSEVDQSGSKVQGDQVAGDKVNGQKVTGDIVESHATKIEKQFNIQLPRAATIIEKLLTKLEHEMDQDIRISETITRLQRYHGGVVRDGVIGLIAKLERSGRDIEIEVALEQKEEFAKLLETWSLYYSAQEIFVYLLARAEHTFNTEVMPEIGSLSVVEVNRLVNREIVTPMVDECAVSVLQIDHVSAMGMLYWLAEQCFIRWH